MCVQSNTHHLGKVSPQAQNAFLKVQVEMFSQILTLFISYIIRALTNIVGCCPLSIFI